MEYLLTDFSQEKIEVQKTLWVAFLGKYIRGCLTKKLFGNTLVWKEAKKMELTGNFIMGKRMFEEGGASWPNDLYKADIYVLTHEKREPWIQEGTTTFYFINDGIKSALDKARQSANGKDIRIQGGANTIQQFLNAGFVDELLFTLHLFFRKNEQDFLLLYIKENNNQF